MDFSIMIAVAAIIYILTLRAWLKDDKKYSRRLAIIILNIVIAIMYTARLSMNAVPCSEDEWCSEWLNEAVFFGIVHLLLLWAWMAITLLLDMLITSYKTRSNKQL